MSDDDDDIEDDMEGAIEERWIALLDTLRARNATDVDAPTLATDDAIARASARIGAELPHGYARVVRALGAIVWPLALAGPDSMRRDPSRNVGRALSPSWLVPFAHDHFGNVVMFDVRPSTSAITAIGELPIVTYDHEEAFDDDDDIGGAEPNAFLMWLEQQVYEAEERERAEERRELEARLEIEIEELVPIACRAFAPSDQEMVAAASALGCTAPEDWRFVVTRFGCIDLPSLHVFAPAELTVDAAGRLVFARGFAFERSADGRTDSVLDLTGGARWTSFVAWLADQFKTLRAAMTKRSGAETKRSVVRRSRS